MLLQILIFFAGIGILYLGAEWLVSGAAGLALSYGIRPMLVGITVVALGTSMPEFVVNVFAAMGGQDDLALGNIVGSNIANVGLILGVSALVMPLAVSRNTLAKEYPMMMIVLLVFYVLALDGVIATFDGILLIAGLIGFFSYVVLDARRHSGPPVKKEVAGPDRENAQESNLRKIVLLVAGILFLTGGARLMIYAAVNIATTLGIDPIIIGLTVVAIGTSLPELAASVVSAFKQEADLSVGNVLGSNLLNVLFVVGFVSLIQPLRVETESLTLHFPVMLAFGMLLLPFAWTRLRITRMEGGVLLASFAGYVYFLALPYL